MAGVNETKFIQGQFLDGSARGLGLITFPNGTHGQPRCEGKFEGDVCVERCKAGEAIKRARQSAANARSKAQQAGS